LVKRDAVQPQHGFIAVRDALESSPDHFKGARDEVVGFLGVKAAVARIARELAIVLAEERAKARFLIH
jgi:hypothetical protein